MKFLDKLKQEWEVRAEKRKADQAIIDRFKLDAEIAGKAAFQEEYRKHIKNIAIGKAKKDAARKSGIMKQRAQQRVRNLQDPRSESKDFFSKFAEYTQRNIARREENLKRTAETRSQIPQRGFPGAQQAQRRKPFAPTSLRTV